MTSPEPCEQCGQVHKAALPNCRPCKGHLSKRSPRAGQPCTKPAMSGQDICETHGGRAPQNRAAAEARIQAAEAEKVLHAFGERVEVDPAEELLDLICYTAGYVRFIRTQVDALTSSAMTWGVTKETDGGVVVGTGPRAELVADTTTTRETKPNIWISMLAEWQDRHAKLLVEALKIGLDMRRVRLSEEKGQVVADVIRATADSILERLLAAGMHTDLTGVFTAALNEAAPRHLRSIAGGLA